MDSRLFTKKILGVDIVDMSQEKVLEYITTRLEEKRKKFYIVTPNPEIIVYAHHHQGFQKVLNTADLAIPDGIGLLWASKILGNPLNHRITGIGLMEELCRRYANSSVTIGLLGGRQGVAEVVADCLHKKYPKLQVVFVAEEWDESGFAKAKQHQVSSIKYQEKTGKIQNTEDSIHDTAHIDILFVAYGFPKQEEWIVKNLDSIPVTMAMGVGGAFDYISGRVGRAPQGVQRAGFEWLWRLIRQPWRIKRQVKLLEFIILVLQEKFARK